MHLRSPQIDAFRCWGQIRAGDRLEVFCQSSPKVVRKLCAVEEYSGRGLVREGRDRCGDVAMMPMQPGELAANYGAPISRRGSDGWTRAGPRLRGFRGAYAARFLEPHPRSFAETTNYLCVAANVKPWLDRYSLMQDCCRGSPTIGQRARTKLPRSRTELDRGTTGALLGDPAV